MSAHTIAVVGARNFPNLALVRAVVATLPEDVTIVSGGAVGVDQAAAAAARARGLGVIECLPDLDGCKERYEFTKRYYERNQRIVDQTTVKVIAFTDKDSGGTWDTIKRARKAGLQVDIVRSTDPCPACGRAFEAMVGLVEHEEPEASGEMEQLREAAVQAGRETRFNPSEAVEQLGLPGLDDAVGCGPGAKEPAVEQEPSVHHIKRAGLGTFALRLKRRLSSSDYADIIIQKDEHSGTLGQRIAEDFLAFLARYPIGHVDIITMPPSSDENPEHVVRQAGRIMACEMVVPFMELFKSRQRKKRGVHAEAPEPELLDDVTVDALKGKVVLCIDDVSTTGRTLRNAIELLNKHRAHAQGLVWLVF